MRTKTKEKSLQVLEKELDAVFSEFIRLRDANASGIVRCFVCEAVWIPWKYSQNLHFVPRGKMPTRYFEKNCHAGCESCNCYDDKHQDKYEQKMVGKYGAEFVRVLKRVSNGLQKFMRSDLVEMIEDYSLKVKELKKQKGI